MPVTVFTFLSMGRGVGHGTFNILPDSTTGVPPLSYSTVSLLSLCVSTFSQRLALTLCLLVAIRNRMAEFLQIILEALVTHVTLERQSTC